MGLAFVVAACATQADIQDVAREQRLIRSQLADTRASLDAVQRDVATVRGRLDEVRYGGRGGPTAGQIASLEARVAALERERAVATVPPPGEGLTGPRAPGQGEPAPPEGAALAREGGAEAPEAYRRGLALMQQGDYDRAIQAFRELLRTQRDSPVAPNAQYWIGEAYYKLGDYQLAVENFAEVRRQWSGSDRAPAAVLKIGLVFLQIGNESDARRFLERVVNDYPSSPEAAQAREKLRALGT
jgi:tol-pal system protein YbgF